MNEKLTAFMPPLDDAPELDDAFFATADVYHGSRLIKKGRPRKDKHKISTTLRLDQKVIDYFKADGKGYQTRINQALLEYIAAHS
ncbi:BrnA antitoxin family protein [Moraxella sp. ZJ142]|uniref:BrnA antitoxin family protein n=1 Tax=Moraxella marmotae TaxID=3344520 RepID=UPI0035D4908E